MVFLSSYSLFLQGCQSKETKVAGKHAECKWASTLKAASGEINLPERANTGLKCRQKGERFLKCLDIPTLLQTFEFLCDYSIYED